MRAHVGLNDARRDGVYADAGRPQLLRQRLGQSEERALRRRIRRLARRADLSPHGADVENAAGLPPQHVRKRRADAVKRAVDVDGKQPAPACGRDHIDEIVIRDPGVVDEYVRAREPRERGVHRRLVRHIAADSDRACFGGDSRRLFVFLFIEKRDPVAARGKRAHGGGSDAARAAGDNNIHK